MSHASRSRAASRDASDKGAREEEEHGADFRLGMIAIGGDGGSCAGAQPNGERGTLDGNAWG